MMSVPAARLKDVVIDASARLVQLNQYAFRLCCLFARHFLRVWVRCRLRERQLDQFIQVLQAVTPQRLAEMQAAGARVWMRCAAALQLEHRLPLCQGAVVALDLVLSERLARKARAFVHTRLEQPQWLHAIADSCRQVTHAVSVLHTCSSVNSCGLLSSHTITTTPHHTITAHF
jgi:hypothetical protein